MYEFIDICVLKIPDFRVIHFGSCEDSKQGFLISGGSSIFNFTETEVPFPGSQVTFSLAPIMAALSFILWASLSSQVSSDFPQSFSDQKKQNACQQVQHENLWTYTLRI